MIIIGAKGFAKEVLEILHRQTEPGKLAFYDDISPDAPATLFGSFPVYRDFSQVKQHFDKIDNRFALGIGSPAARKQLSDRFIAAGGILTSTVSDRAIIGSFGVGIGAGCNILSGATLSNDVTIGVGALVYYGVTVTHDCVVGDFAELSPSVILLGRSRVGAFTQIGAGSIVLPDVKIGSNVIIGAGSLVTKDIPDNVVAYGHPAKVVRTLEPIKQPT